MNFPVLSKVYSLINNDPDKHECENCKLEKMNLKNYEQLEQKLIEYKYDYIQGKILIDVIYCSNIEEALATPATPDSLVLTSDETEIKYSKVKFLIKWFCTKEAVISVKDDKKYCQECFDKTNQTYDTIKKILETNNEMYGLSTSKKIEYILVKNTGTRLSALQIYNIGVPWDLKTFTPRNSVYARASSLYKNGAIKRSGFLYFV